MSVFTPRAQFSVLQWVKYILACTFSFALMLAAVPQNATAFQNASTDQSADQEPRYAQQTPEQLQQLVAPIALYPDSLVAQILVAATFPEQVVEADRWVQDHPDLRGDALARAVDQMPWDPSVKALCAFPSVLGNMDKNISWTSSLGDAYYNQQQDLMDAIQFMRTKAQQAGNLKSTPQQAVTTDPYGDIDIEPASPEVVYVPAYNPWLVYGYPLVAWPGWYPYPGIWFGGPHLSFGVGFGIGWFGGFGWGWGHWGCDWHHHYPIYHHQKYYSTSRTFYNRNYYYRGGGGARGGVGPGSRPPSGVVQGGGVGPGRRPPSGVVQGSGVRPGTPRPPSRSTPRGVFNRPGGTAKPFDGSTPAARGYAPPRGQSGTRSGAFSNQVHGGEARSYSWRGSASAGGGTRGGAGSGARVGGGGHAGSGGGRGGGGRH